MKFGNKVFWAVALFAVLALAGAAVTLTSRMTSAGSSSPTADACDQQEGADEAKDSVGQEADVETADDQCANEPATGDGDGEVNDDGANANEPATGDGDGEVNDDNEAKSAGQLDDGKDLLPQAGITLDAAVAAAQGAASGALGEVDLEQYKGKLVFNIDVGDKDVKVDAANGTVLATGTND